MIESMRRLEDLIRGAKLPPGVEWLNGCPMVISRADHSGENRYVAYLVHMKLPDRLFVLKIDLGHARVLRPTIAIDEEWIPGLAQDFLRAIADGTAAEVKDGGELP